LVEDNPADVRLIKELLQDMDEENVLHVAQDGIEAMNFLYSNCKDEKTKLCPHIIILDLNLPRMSGREVLKKIKGDDDLKTIPVIILTTST
ncbi:MAG TPA: response regulator, partial [Methanobacterium sp.]|nr:response regulator [Methanobacterium sp.]